ncbi:unnamed protein product, partial [Cuscuta epithymum]
MVLIHRRREADRWRSLSIGTMGWDWVQRRMNCSWMMTLKADPRPQAGIVWLSAGQKTGKRRDGTTRSAKTMKIWYFLLVEEHLNFNFAIFIFGFCYKLHVVLFVFVFNNVKTLEHKTGDGESSLPVIGSSKPNSGSTNLVASFEVTVGSLSVCTL